MNLEINMNIQYKPNKTFADLTFEMLKNMRQQTIPTTSPYQAYGPLSIMLHQLCGAIVEQKSILEYLVGIAAYAQHFAEQINEVIPQLTTEQIESENQKRINEYEGILHTIIQSYNQSNDFKKVQLNELPIKKVELSKEFIDYIVKSLAY